MALEIERKYRVKDLTILSNLEGKQIAQGYIVNNPEKVVRVRILDKKAFLTIKGKNNGVSRLEFEYPIAVDEAQELLDKFCKGCSICKKRYYLPQDDLCWEIDVFDGENKGLIVAEIELPNVDTFFSKPDWLGEEVSEDIRYYNSNLISYPYSKW